MCRKPVVRSEKVRAYHREYCKQNRTTPDGWAKCILRNTKKRAREKEVPFDLTWQDIRTVMPADNCCPIFKTPFQFGNGNSRNNPSVDRLIPEKGYTKGNIAVISMKANAIKSTANASELYLVANWLKNIEDTYAHPN